MDRFHSAIVQLLLSLNIILLELIAYTYPSEVTSVSKTLALFLFVVDTAHLFVFTKYIFYYIQKEEGVNHMEEHPITKELRMIRVCLVILIIVTLFSGGVKVIKTSSNHQNVPPTNNELYDRSNMTQIGENTFVVRNTDPNSGGYNTVKIFTYNPKTNKITQVKEFNFENSFKYVYQLSQSE
ncbi:YmzC family protein [Bacillus rhizoplanae]|uniref:YmzC family protein n=2 Tax=Bacillus rhizoplanae TaxID=2880966 RepID=UPI003D1935B4